MPRSIWKGAIAFGLVYVPVALYPASQEDGIDFDWLDKRSMDPVGYQRINKRTGKTIKKENIVKGVKQDDGSYVVVSEEEIRAAYPKTTQTIEIASFVKAGEIAPVFLEKPYFLEPAARADKAYALLREAMAKAGVVGIARLVLHAKEHLAALMPAGNVLLLNTLRWASEVRTLEDLALPAKSTGLKDGELKMAGQLIDALTAPWKPAEYEDRFAGEIHRLIRAKVEAGETEHVTPLEHVEEGGTPSNVVDLTALLKQSLGERHGRAARRSAAGSAAASAHDGDRQRAPAPAAPAAHEPGAAAKKAAAKSPASASKARATGTRAAKAGAAAAKSARPARAAHARQRA
jgi:DNA end-binding protein Ku